jgi:hypothetical protein
MKIVLLYIRILTKCNPNYVEPTPYSLGEKRFADSYRKFKPSIAHRFITVNAGDQSKMDHSFDDITTENIPYNGTGWDCGTYQEIASKLDCDLVVCFNTLAYLWRAGWLEPLVSAACKYKKGVFGPTASCELQPHLRTPCIAFHPDLIREYPIKVIDRSSCCQFEHGPSNFSLWAMSKGYPAIMVAAGGEYWQKDWRKPANIYRRGDQTNCLVWDRHTLLYANADPVMRKKLEADADTFAFVQPPVYTGKYRIL